MRKYCKSAWHEVQPNRKTDERQQEPEQQLIQLPGVDLRQLVKRVDLAWERVVTLDGGFQATQVAAGRISHSYITN